jgi:hypothetical protein
VAPDLHYTVSNPLGDLFSEGCTADRKKLCSVIDAGAAKAPSCHPAPRRTTLIKNDNLVASGGENLSGR